MCFWMYFVNKVFISNTKVLSTRKNRKKYIPSWNSEAKATHKKTYIYSVFHGVPWMVFHGWCSMVFPEVT